MLNQISGCDSADHSHAWESLNQNRLFGFNFHCFFDEGFLHSTHPSWLAYTSHICLRVKTLPGEEHEPFRHSGDISLDSMCTAGTAHIFSKAKPFHFVLWTAP